MVNLEKIDGLIRQLRQYTGYLQDITAMNEKDFLSDPFLVGSARYYLQISIETCINIANHIIASKRLRAPKDYKDTFIVLNQAGMLPDEFTETMRELAGLRNLLVHLYWEVDDQMVFHGIQSELGDFETYIDHVLDCVDRND